VTLHGPPPPRSTDGRISASEQAAKRFADGLRGRRFVGASALQELGSQLRVEPHGFDGRRRRAEGGTGALRASGDQPIDVVARLGLGGEVPDLRVGDRPAGAGMAADALVAHRSINLLYLARMGIA
jgi:hypothetical protein